MTEPGSSSARVLQPRDARLASAALTESASVSVQWQLDQERRAAHLSANTAANRVMLDPEEPVAQIKVRRRLHAAERSRSPVRSHSAAATPHSVSAAKRGSSICGSSAAAQRAQPPAADANRGEAEFLN